MQDLSVLKRFSIAQESLVVQQSDFSLKTITEMVEAKAIDIEPHYQRRERWNTMKQSSLIESFILNVPVPPIYLSEDDYGTYSVIDGKQRITSIKNFINGDLKLKDLKKFPDLNGFYFQDLPASIKNALTIRPYLRIVTLLKQSDPNLKYEVFLRLNTGGEHLRPQEVRNVAYSGTLNTLLFTLSDDPILKERLKITDTNSSSYKNMDDLEHILRFFTLLEKWENIGNVISIEMDDYMALNRKAPTEKILFLQNKFKAAINGCWAIWGEYTFNKPIENGKWREQLISPLYDAQMVAVSKMIDENKLENLIRSKENILTATRLLYETDFDFVKAAGQATNNPKNIELRIKKMYELLNSFV